MINWQSKRFNALNLKTLYNIIKLRQDVFMIEQNCIYPDVDGIDQHAQHIIGYWQQDEKTPELCAYARIIPPAPPHNKAAIGRVVVKPSFRGKALGMALVTQTLRVIETTFPNTPIKIFAQAHLETFYSRFDFTPTSEVYDEDGIPHIDMLKTPVK